MENESLKLDLTGNWLAVLLKQIGSIRKKRNAALNEINDTVLYSDPAELAKVYVEPFCQEVNPADRYDEDFFTAREPLFRKVTDFLRTPTYHQGNNQLFILSDAGMGKTSFLAMLKLLHLTSFWPKSHECKLLKLGEQTLDDIQEIPNKRKTLLLLDSLDEDPLAYGKPKERLLDILKATHMFHRVIITCRTQFFPSYDEDPLEYPGRIRIDGFICPSKYLSIFNNKQVQAYLSKRFPTSLFRSNKETLLKAESIINRMASLRCRPMLLSFIEDLVNAPSSHSVGSEYAIYHFLVESWLIREQTKSGRSSQTLLKACSEVAFKMQSEKKVKITPKELKIFLEKINCLNTLEEMDITGRSLLNRNSSGDYRFSHYSIQEFLVVLYIFNFSSIDDTRSIYPTDFIKTLLEQNKDILKIKIEKELINQYSSIESSINPFYGAEEYRFHGKTEIMDLIRKTIPELDDLEIEAYETDYDIPTFIRKKIALAKENIKTHER